MAVANEPLLLLDRRLQAWRTARPGVAQAIEYEAQLIRESLTMAQAVETQPFPLPREHLVARVREGMPLLNDQPAHLDIRSASNLFGRLVVALRDHRQDDELRLAQLDALVAALSSGQLDPQRLFSEAFVRHADHLAEIAMEHGLDADPLTGLAERAAAPLLRAYAARLLPMVEQLDDGSHAAAVWRQGYCPVCGGWPALVEQSAAEPTRRFRCEACGSGWPARTLACPYCGNDDHALLPTLTVDGEPRSRVVACDRCRGYVKTLDTPDAAPPALLSLDHIGTGFLDAVAVARGYHRPSGSGFRIELAVPEEDWLDELGDV